MTYRINGGRTKNIQVAEWKGGERYGDENDDYYAEYRGKVTGAKPGDKVQVTFSGNKSGKASQQPAVHVHARLRQRRRRAGAGRRGLQGREPGLPGQRHRAEVRRGVREGHQRRRLSRPTSGTSTLVACRTTSASSTTTTRSSGISATTGSPRIPRTRPSRPRWASCRTSRWPRSEQYTTMAVRDYLNAGGKLVHAGETAQYSGLPGVSDSVGGLFYGLNGDPEAECVVDTLPGLLRGLPDHGRRLPAVLPRRVHPHRQCEPDRA